MLLINLRKITVIFFSLMSLALGVGCSTSKLDNSPPSNNPPSNNPPDAEVKTFYRDADQDGYGDAKQSQEALSAPEGYVENSQDCNDDDAEINPQSIRAENLDGTKDFNCDGIYAWLYRYAKSKDSNQLIEQIWDPATRKVVVYYREDKTNPESKIQQSYEYSYDTQGHLLTYRKHGSGDLGSPVTYSYEASYDAQGKQLTHLWHGSGDLDSPVTSSYEYSYDAQGHLLTYRYHPNGDLDSFVTNSSDYEYSYDSKSNTLNSIGHHTELVKDQNNQYMLVDYSSEESYDARGKRLTYRKHAAYGLDSLVTYSAEFSYDARGNQLTEREHGSGDLDSSVTGSSEYSYDARSNQLTYRQHTNDLDSSVTYSAKSTYDAEGKRLTYWVNENGDLDGMATYFEEYSSYSPVQLPISLDGIYHAIVG